MSTYPVRNSSKQDPLTTRAGGITDNILQVRAMLEALKHSNEPEHLVREARRYLKGLKGNLVQLKKHKAAKEHAAREEAAHAANMAGYTTAPAFRMPQGYGQQGGGYDGQQGGYGGQQGFGGGAGYGTPNYW